MRYVCVVLPLWCVCTAIHCNVIVHQPDCVRSNMSLQIVILMCEECIPGEVISVGILFA